MIRQCCVCKKVHENGEWQKRTTTFPDIITHTYCPSCLQRELATADMDFRQLHVSMAVSPS